MAARELIWDDANLQHFVERGLKPNDTEQLVRNNPFVRRHGDRYLYVGQTDGRRWLTLVREMSRARFITGWDSSQNEVKLAKRHGKGLR